MLTYLPNDPLPCGKYGFSYQELRENYRRYRLMDNTEFLANLLEILHFAIFVCYVKELQAERALSDEGIVHELVHLMLDERQRAMDGPPGNIIHGTYGIEKIRDLFNHDCCLA